MNALRLIDEQEIEALYENGLDFGPTKVTLYLSGSREERQAQLNELQALVAQPSEEAAE